MSSLQPPRPRPLQGMHPTCGPVLKHFHTPVATPPPAASQPPLLSAFTSAAASGKLLWVMVVDGHPEVCSGATPAPAASDLVGQLFVGALRAHFGEAASAIAEREWQLGPQPRRLLPARTVHHAVACAESALSLLMAQSHLLRVEFSPVMLGWRFRRVAESLGLDPAGLGAERRQALEQLLQAEFASPLPVVAEAVSDRLRALLTQTLH